MQRPSKLSRQEIDAQLESRSGWSLRDDGSLHKRFVFEDFVHAFGWMTEIAMVAETLAHHPDWTNVYKTVDVRLTTHDANGLTALDFALADAMDRRYRA